MSNMYTCRMNLIWLIGLVTLLGVTNSSNIYLERDYFTLSLKIDIKGVLRQSERVVTRIERMDDLYTLAVSNTRNKAKNSLYKDIKEEANLLIQKLNMMTHDDYIMIDELKRVKDTIDEGFHVDKDKYEKRTGTELEHRGFYNHLDTYDKLHKIMVTRRKRSIDFLGEIFAGITGVTGPTENARIKSQLEKANIAISNVYKDNNYTHDSLNLMQREYKQMGTEEEKLKTLVHYLAVNTEVNRKEEENEFTM